MTQRLQPPCDGKHNTIVVNGRSYTCALSATIDVPDQDAFVMISNGWVASAPGGVGATTMRPTSPTIGLQFHDSTLGYNIVWDGKVWRNPTSGASV